MVTVKIYYHPGVLSLDNAVNIHNNIITVAGGGEKRERNGRRTGTERERELR